LSPLRSACGVTHFSFRSTGFDSSVLVAMVITD
jgi:hypothetical protein